MMDEILQHIFIERLLINETANLMGVSVQQLKDVMRNMEQMGYIKKINAVQECGSCVSCKVCNTDDLGKVQYMITAKGYNLIKK